MGRQEPVEHDTAVLLLTAAVLQAVPQAPQWVAVLSDSQPLRALPSHWPKPDAQTMLHIPPMHDGVPPVEAQAIPQPPQWLVLLLVLMQPAPTDEQSVVGIEQVAAHMPDEQRVPAAQTVPQPPQLLLSVSGLTQTPLQETCPMAQTQVPIEQKEPPVHARPQAPQWVLSAARLVSQPLVALPSQLPKPALQVPRAQAEAAQEAVALGKTQRLPQVPQWLTAVRWSTSQPLPTLQIGRAHV